MEFPNIQSIGGANDFQAMITDTEMQDLSKANNSEIYGAENRFEKLPLEMLNEIFKYLSVSDRNKVRKVSYSWDRAIKHAFGVKIVLNNHNIEDMAHSSDILDIQVRNLTTKLPLSPVFSQSESVQTLEIIGMILSGSLIQLCTEFRNLSCLKLNRIYLETDRQVPINPVDKLLFPSGISNLSMRFLKTIHKHSGFSIGRNNDLYALTASDNIVLNILTEFHFPKLISLQFYHAMEEEIEAERNSDMINRARNLELDTETESSRIPYLQRFN
ncbi:unnamed protein product [Allacma fusca]|uniref:F-box domain-containing protein n=1 Tax=Allacma fusca TaxID=39272 RepID=A0A8J2M854_9HEXA|nr:unnamed protein product [Allacma fusca]